MTNDTSTLVLLVAVLIVPGLLLIGAGWYLPSWIPRRSAENRALGKQLWQHISDSRRKIGRMRDTLSRYADLESADLRAIHDTSLALLNQTERDNEAIRRRLAALPPGPPAPADNTPPTLAWHHLWQVPRTTLQLRRLTSQARSLLPALDKVAQGIGRLQTIDETLRTGSRLWREERLQPLIAQIEAEEGAGINAETWRATAIRLNHALETIGRQAAPDLPVPRLDQLTVQLETLQTELVALEKSVHTSRKARLDLDKKREEAGRGVAALTATPLPVWHRPADTVCHAAEQLRQALERLLTATDTARHTADWATAHSHVGAIKATLPLVRELVETLPVFRKLEQQLTDALPETESAIVGLRSEMTLLLQRCCALTESDLHDLPRLQQLQQQIRDGRTQATALLSRTEQERDRLQHLADTRRREALDAWQTLRRTVTLKDDEPLVWSMSALDAHYETAENRPILLSHFAQAAQDLNARCQSHHRKILDQRRHLEQEQKALAGLYQTSTDQGAHWASLLAPGAAVRENVAQADQSARQLGDPQRSWHIDELFEAFSQFDRYAGNARAAFSEMEQKMVAFNEILAEIRKETEQLGDTPISGELSHSIDYHLEQARADRSYEVARKHLIDAWHFVQQLPRTEAASRFARNANRLRRPPRENNP